MEIDVIIPLYKPDKTLFALIEMLNRQTVPVNRIILMNTEQKYFEQLMYGVRLKERYRNVEVVHLSQREFDHGGTRKQAVSKSKADVVVLMTQDAMPKDEMLLEKLTQHLTNEANNKIAAAYGRQLAKENSSILEHFSRMFNYPEKSRIKTQQDLPTLGIKTYFCSNVCAAYRRDIYNELGGFVKHTIFNEDMIFAAGAIKAGYAISYEAEAQVYHSHDYTNSQQFKRNFDLGVSQAQFPEIFRDVPSESEGKKLVKEVTAHLRKKKMMRKLPYFYMQCASKYAGYLLGRHYRILPHWLVLKCTASRYYWK
ncbi:MAG: glycosyltransferase [Lachnospiraceae bacterium]|nr:glycosyltransferase [Lachnospiraceae bacterium]